MVLIPPMLKIALLRFKFERKRLGLSMAETNKFYRKLYGYHSCSYYGRYHHLVEGLLDELNGKKIANSAIIIPMENLKILKKYLEENSAIFEIISDKIFIEQEEFENIKSMGKMDETQK